MAVICEIGVGLRPSEMTLKFDTAYRVLSYIKLEKVKRALSSVRSLRIQDDDLARSAPFQMEELLQCLPRSAVLRIRSYQRNPQILSLVNHPPHLIQLEYNITPPGFNYGGPEVPTWCRSGGRFDSLSLRGCAVGEITCFCKKLALYGAPTLQNFLSSSSGLDIEELHCGSEVIEDLVLYQSRISAMDKLVKLTCTFSFALALLKRRRLPMLQELVFILPLDASLAFYRTSKDCLGSITDLLLESSDADALMRLISIPIWAPWESLFKVAKILSQSDNSRANPTLFLPSFPHPRLLLLLVNSLNGKPVTQRPDFPACLSKASCKTKGVCYQCHNGGWTCADVERCRRGRRGELVAITRYTLSS